MLTLWVQDIPGDTGDVDWSKSRHEGGDVGLKTCQVGRGRVNWEGRGQVEVVDGGYDIGGVGDVGAVGEADGRDGVGWLGVVGLGWGSWDVG